MGQRESGHARTGSRPVRSAPTSGLVAFLRFSTSASSADGCFMMTSPGNALSGLSARAAHKSVRCSNAAPSSHRRTRAAHRRAHALHVHITHGAPNTRRARSRARAVVARRGSGRAGAPTWVKRSPVDQSPGEVDLPLLYNLGIVLPGGSSSRSARPRGHTPHATQHWTPGGGTASQDGAHRYQLLVEELAHGALDVFAQLPPVGDHDGRLGRPVARPAAAAPPHRAARRTHGPPTSRKPLIPTN